MRIVFGLFLLLLAFGVQAQEHAISLQEFEQYALASSPILKQANSLVARAAGQAKQAGLLPNPSVGYQGEQIRGGSYKGGEQGGFVQQAFPLGGKLALRRNVYEQARRSEEVGATETRYRLLGDVGTSFYSALAAQETVTLRRELVSVATDAVETSRQLKNVGQAEEPDVLQAEVEAEHAKSDLEMAQRAYQREFLSLTALVGRPDIPVSPLAGDLRSKPDIRPEQIVEAIVRESPSFKRAQQQVLQAQAALKAAGREIAPDLVLRAGLQQNNEPIGVNGVVGMQGFATASLSLPVFNRNGGNIAAARADLERAQAEAMRVQLYLRAQAQSRLQDYLLGLSQAERYQAQMIPRAQRAYELYLTKYRGMASPYSQVILAQRTLFDLRVSYINALESVWTSAVALQNYVLTGGFETPMAGDPIAMPINLPMIGGGGGE